MRGWIGRIALLLALLLALPTAALAELDEIQGLLDSLGEPGDEPSPEEPTELDELESLLQGLGGEEDGDAGSEEPPEREAPPAADDGAPGEEEAEQATPEPPAAEGVAQADYALMEGFSLATLNDTVAVQVPAGWGNNAGASDAMVSYSPANSSGATDPFSSTLSTIWYSAGAEGSAVLDEYVDNIRKEDIFSNVEAEPFTVAGQQGLALSYDMNVGTNSFNCRSACFLYDSNLYTVEMYQGMASGQDYFPVYEDVIASEAIMAGEWNVASTPAPTATPEPRPEVTPTAVPQDAPPAISREEPTAIPQDAPTAVPSSASTDGDLGDFTYAINGHAYSFPTAVGELVPGDLNLDGTLELSCERDSSAAGDALINTLYFVLERFPTRELVGVTNLTRRIVPMSEGVLTALVDTQASAVDLELPGGLRIGSAEAAIASAFPEFSGRALDGLADFRGNDLLYACNVRDDGCDGYVIIRNDPPYCSALSIICEDGLIREINFQCLGAAVAGGIFL